MNWRKHILETATLIAAAAVCALVSNALASRERKLVVVSRYSSAPARPIVAPSRPVQEATPQPRTPPTAQPDNPATPQPSNSASRSRNAATAQPARKAADDSRSADRFPPHPDKPYVEIHYDDVAWLHANGALFLDARRTSVYEDGHIAGARPFPVWESDIDDRVNQLYAERSDPKEQNRPIVVYCSGGDCEDSHMLAQKLWGIQFNNVYVYKDGFPDWMKRGGEVHVGDKP